MVDQRQQSSALARRGDGFVTPEFWSRVRQFGLPIAGVALALLAWEWAASGPAAVLPKASDTVVALFVLLGTEEFWLAAWDTMGTALLGFVVAAVLGVAIGLLAGLNQVAFRATRVPIEVMKPVPPIIILPLMVLQLGATHDMVVALIMWGLIPLIAVTTASGVRDLDPIMNETANSYRLRPFTRLRSVVIPSALPFIATGLRVSASLAVIIAIVGEIIGGAPGLGRQVGVYRQAGIPETMFAYVIALGMFGVAIYYLLLVAERRVLRWDVTYRETVHPSRLGIRLASLAGSLSDAFWRTRLGHALENVQAARAARRRSRPPRRTAVSARPNSLTRTVVLNAIQFGVPLALFAFWWWWSTSGSSPFYPPVPDIMNSFRELWLFDHFMSDIVPSLSNFIGGLAASIVVGIAVGLVLAKVRWLNQMFEPIITFLRSIPSVAYIPVLITMVGFGESMRIIAIVLAAVFPMIIATVDGVRGVDSTLDEVARTYRVSRRRKLFSIYLPAASPRIFAGIEIAIAMSLVVMIASELIGTSFGIGAQVARAETALDFSNMWAGILLLALLGLAFITVFTIARRFILAWYFGARAAARAQ